MRSRRMVLALVLVTGALLGSAPATAGTHPTMCTVSAEAHQAGVFRCSYEGQPPAASVVADVEAGSVAFQWICDNHVVEFVPGTAFYSAYPRVFVQQCQLIAEILVGPATFTATGS